MEITKNIDKTAHTVKEIAEVQRDYYEAFAENLSAAQGRGIGLAEGGLEFVRLQEDSARAAQEWFANGLRLWQTQQRSAEFLQGWTGDAVEAAREQTEHNARTAETFARVASRQQEGLRALSGLWFGTYRDLFSPLAYAQRGARTFQRATRQGLETTEQAARRGLRAAEEVTDRTDEVLRRTQEATREAELRTVVFAALGTSDYDALTVDEISARLDGLTAEQLKKVREYEKRNKDRETLVGQIDRKIRAKNS